MYVYNKYTKEIIDQRKVISYDGDKINLGNETIIVGEEVELSSLPDLSETLLADYRERHPAESERVSQLEALVAQLIFGGEW